MNHGTGSSGTSFLFGLVLTSSQSSLHYSLHCLQAYKHIFTSPSSVEKEVKATRSGNARIHGMTRVTPASLAYIATQVHISGSKFLAKLRLNSYLAPLHSVFFISFLQV